MPITAPDPAIPPPLQVSYRVDGDRAVVTVAGRIGLGSIGRLRAALTAAILESTSDVDVDLRDTITLHPAGIAVIHRAHRRLLGRRRALRMTNVPPGVDLELRASGLWFPRTMATPVPAQRAGADK